jgi:hypothetical protein
MLSAFTRGTVLLPNDDALPTADASTERFEENLLPNGALLPNSAHMSVSSLYQFFVLTITYRRLAQGILLFHRYLLLYNPSVLPSLHEFLFNVHNIKYTDIYSIV